MTASERMAGLVEAALARYLWCCEGGHQPDDAKKSGAAIDALLAAIGELERDRDAQAAEVARLAGVARDACQRADIANEAGLMSAPMTAAIDALRASIPTPDPAAFVAAVDRLIESVRVHEGAGPGFGSQALDAVVKSRAALLALGGAK